MSEMTISPFLCCGSIIRGDSIFEISKKFPDHKEFKKGPFSKFLTSSIMSGNVHVFYSEHGSCVGVEVFPPIKLVCKGINLFEDNLKSITKSLMSQDIRYEISDSGLDFPSLGLSLYSHNFDETLICSVDSVYVDFLEQV